MTPKQRSALQGLQNQLCSLEYFIRGFQRELRKLPDEFETAFSQEKDAFSEDEINELLSFNQKLAALEQYLCNLGAKESAHLDARVSDPNDPLDDYEIDATLYFTLHEDDSAFDEDHDNFLTQRSVSLKHLNQTDWGLGVAIDHREPSRQFPGVLNEAPHCWLFHDIYDHSYGLEQPRLTLQDCLRIDSIWVDVAVRHQATMDIKTGKWQQPLNPAST